MCVDLPYFSFNVGSETDIEVLKAILYIHVYVYIIICQSDHDNVIMSLYM